MSISLRLLAASVFLLAPLASGQTLTTGDVTGAIKDVSGAVVPNAGVSLKNVDTNDVRSTVTNESGQYRFTLLKPGDYTISAQTSGLRSNVEKFAVQVGEARELNITMNVQGTSEVIEVQAQAAVIQTENENLTTAVNYAQITSPPM